MSGKPAIRHVVSTWRPAGGVDHRASLGCACHPSLFHDLSNPKVLVLVHRDEPPKEEGPKCSK